MKDADAFYQRSNRRMERRCDKQESEVRTFIREIRRYAAI